MSVCENGEKFLESVEDVSTANIASYEVCFNLSRYSDSLYRQLNVYFPEKMNRSVSKRRAEFLAGRYASRLAIEKLRGNTLKVPLRLDSENRAPIWPVGIIGSITHTAWRACAIVADANKFLAVGVDIENWVSNEQYQSLQNRILTEPERLLMKQIVKIMQPRAFFTLAFSAKESLFKALYPMVRCYFDFLDAEIVMIDTNHKMISIRLLKDIVPNNFLACEGSVFTIHYNFFEACVKSQLVIKRT
ncbi:4'-phosphopantetheinyl transferase family protein [Cellvibrio sp. QJXJ]|uniref:4'-phosphopantetheinyl transferase family protein n=1 Tax=Cellvibrio sp. QJXJ TaxID=2964606 RepID=UPI0021C460E6|nr:4'-phosphopantetheinyl transferase superfamily protein [Cellvibrio sp. QJXJ]UUA73399.1 4'-phosphopantetheinyl transferase superfamily protein [Cellvibrio sp. QJXJ]